MRQATWVASRARASSTIAEVNSVVPAPLPGAEKNATCEGGVCVSDIPIFCSAATGTHGVEEFGVALGGLDLVEQEFHRIDVIHAVKQLAQDPHLLQYVGLEQQFLAPGAGAIDVDRRIDALFCRRSRWSSMLPVPLNSS